MLIIEGPDMLGKTTFAEKLVKAVKGIAIDKFGLPEASYTTAKEWLDRYKVDSVADRFVISEPIYGLICRGKTNTPVDVWDEIWAGIEERGGCHVLLYYTDSVTYRNVLQQRYDPAREAFSKDQCKQVAEAYEELALDKDWNGYRIPYGIRVKSVKVNSMVGHAGSTVIVQPDRASATHAADWLGYHDERAIVNALWRSDGGK